MQEDPSDRSAARKLAANIAEAAAIDLEVTLASEIGVDSVATAEVEVRVLKWKAAVFELTRQLLDAAASLERSLPAEPGDGDRSLWAVTVSGLRSNRRNCPCYERSSRASSSSRMKHRLAGESSAAAKVSVYPPVPCICQDAR